jgi:hypothetical protein
METSNHNTEQSARGYLMYQLARRRYAVQITDSRFPTEDLLAVSPSGKHFGIDVKGQKKRSLWRVKEPPYYSELFYVFIYVPIESEPKVFIMDCDILRKLWCKYKDRIKTKSTTRKTEPWGLNWTTPHSYEDRYDLLPK